MSDHLHAEPVEGCFRCDLSHDEAVADEIEQAVEAQVRRIVEECPALVYLDVGHGYVLARRDRMHKTA